MNDYFKQPGQSSGKLSDFRAGGPDKVLWQEKREADGTRWQYDFERGNAFEALCMDWSSQNEKIVFDSGGNSIHHEFFPKYFLKRFFVSEIERLSFESKGKPSHASEICGHIAKIASGVKEFRAEDFENMIRKNKDGTPSKTYSKSNALIEECVDNPGKIPMTQIDFSSLLDLAKKTSAMPLPDWFPFGGTFGEFFRVCEWQVPVYWSRPIPNDSYEILPVKKKALADCLFVHDDFTVLVDLKWTGQTIGQWVRQRLPGYLMQAEHYHEGFSTKYKNVLPMTFVVAAVGDKNTPPTVKAITMDDGKCTGRERCFCSQCRRAEYLRVSKAYAEWEQSGRKSVGYLPAGKEKVRV